MTNAILSGTNKVTIEDVIAVPEVPFTKTFHPVHHCDFVTAVKESVNAIGLNIIKEEYVLAAEGNKMFAVYDLNQGSSDLCWSIGIRNSMNKSMSLGITAGTRVFVCENLCFSGEFLAFRRHTSGLDIDELAFLAFRAMRSMVPRLKKFQQWHEGLREYHLTETDMKILLVEIILQQVIPPSKFNRFNELYHNVYGNSLWGFHETVTDVLKGNNLLTLPKKNKALNQIIDGYINSLDTAGPSSLGDFFQERALLHR